MEIFYNPKYADRSRMQVFGALTHGFDTVVLMRTQDTAPGGILVDRRVVTVAAGPEAAFAAIRRIGGATGWYYADWLWRLRGAADRLVGGVGMRGRRDPDHVALGDVVDCWRVEDYEPGRRLRLALELRQPGQGWLEFEVAGNGAGSKVKLTASYDPGSWIGRLYWQLVSPVHNLMFRGMLRGISAASDGRRR